MSGDQSACHVLGGYSGRGKGPKELVYLRTSVYAEAEAESYTCMGTLEWFNGRS